MGAVDTILSALKQLVPTFAKSDGSIEAKIIDVVGTYADSEAIERRNTLNTINNALSNQRVTRTEYYRRKAVLFQTGDTLYYDPINFGGYYEQIKPENQIIKQAFIIGEFPTYTLLVNALGSDGHLRALNTSELESFKTYFQAFQPLGMTLTINSLPVAQIFDDNLIIWVSAGTDAQAAVDAITNNLLVYEQTLRKDNTVSLTEIEDVIQQYAGVRAVGWGDPFAKEVQTDGTTTTVYPEQGLFNLTNGAFTFATPITLSRIKVLP